MLADTIRILTLPGLGNSGPNHWQTHWENARRGCERVELGGWDDPRPGVWIDKIDQAVAADARPAVLAAHSLGCIAAALWALQARNSHIARVRGLLLVAPPDVDKHSNSEILKRFGPAPREALPVPSILVASRNDVYAPFAYSTQLARAWGARFVDAGSCGHINAESRLHDWPQGQAHLSRLIGAESAVAPAQIRAGLSAARL